MRWRLVCCLCVLALSAPVRAEGDRPGPAISEFFESKVRPVLVERCQRCHGAEKQKGGLRLDSRAAVLEGGKSGAVVVAGNPEKSTLVQAIRHAGTLHMPPDKPLSAEQVTALATWVKLGLPWPVVGGSGSTASALKITDKDRAFWAFRPVRQPSLPAVKTTAWPSSAIDRFILARLEDRGLTPSAEADRRTLLRRVTFDLIGLPPTPEEIDAFLQDQSADAFAKVVDRLLASPHYGERWARHWLDVARYGEDQAHTFQSRKYPDGWRYRDWVVKALNDDMPYDRFVMEQIAGDLLEGGNRADRLAATGFFALGPVYYGKAPADELDDRVDTLCRGFLGLTVACARCHDHKFDPIPTHDYYALSGIFASTAYREYVVTPKGEIDDEAKSEPTDKVKDQKAARRPVIHGLTEGENPANLRLHLRGNPANLGDEVPRRFLQVLSRNEPAPFAVGSGRLDLARAVASKDNPLTARVMVNRIWAHHFGRGIVGTPSNFGSLGERPTHPELLDWLAGWFVENGWSIKKLHREILLSAVYRQSGQHNATAVERDPDNHLLWRMNRRRLEVEPWRDAMLAVAGNLDRKPGGPSRDLQAPENRRRTLYAAVSRHDLDPVLRLFDFPDPNLTSDQRVSSTVPSQQLFALNGDFMVQQAQALATRLTIDIHQDDPTRIRRAFVLLYGRPATDREVSLGLAFLTAVGPRNGSKATAWEQYAQVLLAANEFMYVD